MLKDRRTPAATRFKLSFRLLALLFAAFLVFVVITADIGVVDQLFGWMINYPNGDKVGHFVLYGVMALLLYLGFPTRRIGVWFLRPFKSSLLLAAIATLEEISQSFFPGRSASWLDLAASLAGIFIFSEIGAWVIGRFRSPSGISLDKKVS